MERPVLVYDGDCGMCTTSARFVERRLRRAPTDFDVLPSQVLDLPSLGLTTTECEEALQWVATDGRHVSAQAAVAMALRSSRAGWRPLGVLLDAPGARELAGVAYRWVARNRHRLPGGTPACEVSKPQQPPSTPHPTDAQES